MAFLNMEPDRTIVEVMMSLATRQQTVRWMASVIEHLPLYVMKHTN